MDVGCGLFVYIHNCLHTCYLWHAGRKNDSVSCTHEQETIAGEQQVQHVGYFCIVLDIMAGYQHYSNGSDSILLQFNNDSLRIILVTVRCILLVPSCLSKVLSTAL